MMTDQELLFNKYKSLNKAELLRLQDIARELYNHLDMQPDSEIALDEEGGLYWTGNGDTL